MLYEAVNTHSAAQCPLNTQQGKDMIKQLVSEANLKQAGVKIDDADVSCPKASPQSEHKGFFLVEADNPAAVTKFFGPMKVDIREVVPFSEVVKSL